MGPDDRQARLLQSSVDSQSLLLTRPKQFQPAIDIKKDKEYSIYLDVPGMTKDDILMSRQNVTTIVKGTRMRPYPELLRAERAERQYGEFTQTFKVPQEFERKWSHVSVNNGVMKITFKPDSEEEGLAIENA